MQRNQIHICFKSHFIYIKLWSYQGSDLCNCPIVRYCFTSFVSLGSHNSHHSRIASIPITQNSERGIVIPIYTRKMRLKRSEGALKGR